MSKTVELKPSTEWLKDTEFERIIVVDPDGWDRSNLDASFAEPISRREFQMRLACSSCMLRRAPEPEEGPTP